MKLPRWCLLCLAFSVVLVFVAENMELQDPRGYTLGCRLAMPLLTLGVHTAVLSIVACAVAVFGPHFLQRAVKTFVVLLTLSSLCRIGSAIYTQQVLKPQLNSALRTLVDEGEIPPPSLLSADTPPQYTDAYRDGFRSGRAALGHAASTYSRDDSLYKTATAYKQGWDDGFLLGQARETYLQQHENSRVFP